MVEKTVITRDFMQDTYSADITENALAVNSLIRIERTTVAFNLSDKRIVIMIFTLFEKIHIAAVTGYLLIQSGSCKTPCAAH